MQVRRVQRVTHAVVDRKAAEAFYERVFGARPFFRGRLEPPGRDASLLMAGDVCLELTAPPPLSRQKQAYVERFGGIFSSLTLEVDDLPGYASRLEALGVRFLEQSSHSLRLDPATSHGVALELSDARLPLPSPAASAPHQSGRQDGSPLGRLRSWNFGLLTARPEEAAPFFEAALAATPVDSPGRGGRQLARFHTFGESVVAIVGAPSWDRDLSGAMRRQGGGVHSVGFAVDDLAAVSRALRERGVGIIDRAGDRLFVAHPRAAFGARFVFSTQDASHLRGAGGEGPGAP